jgi:hypothetical protein
LAVCSIRVQHRADARILCLRYWFNHPVAGLPRPTHPRDFYDAFATFANNVILVLITIAAAFVVCVQKSNLQFPIISDQFAICCFIKCKEMEMIPNGTRHVRPRALPGITW